MTVNARHEGAAPKSMIGGRFDGPDKLAHLIEVGEMVPCLGRGLGECQAARASS